MRCIEASICQTDPTLIGLAYLGLTYSTDGRLNGYRRDRRVGGCGRGFPLELPNMSGRAPTIKSNKSITVGLQDRRFSLDNVR
jgi:predicted small lipoprotein YifL